MSQSRQSLEEMTLRQLRKIASEYEISRYSRMRKTELIEAIQAAQARRTSSAPLPMSAVDGQTEVEAAKYAPSTEPIPPEALASVDEGLPDLPSGYGESRIVLMPRDPQWAYAYWDIPNEHKEDLRRQGGARLALRFYDVTDIDLNYQAPHSLQQYECDELAREWFLPIPVSDRDYAIEIGYLCNDGRWLVLARSAPVHIPPVYPSDWIEDHFMTVTWDQDLRGKTLMTLTRPGDRVGAGDGIYEKIFGLAESAEAQRVAGSLFGSLQHVPGSLISSFAVPVSSYVFPSGVGMWALPTVSGLTMSGVGFSASMPPLRARQFWLIADAELIVYGATEPDATVTIGGTPIQLNPDGTFRFQMSFQDGLIDYPIMAVAADGEQNRSIHMKFTRETPYRNTNTKEEADREINILDDWFNSKEIRENIKVRVLKEYEKLVQLETLDKEKWIDLGFEEEEVKRLKKSYEAFIGQPNLKEIMDPIIQGLSTRISYQNLPTIEQVAEVVIPKILTAAVDGKILIPQNENIVTHIANFLKEFIKDLGKNISSRSIGEPFD